MLAHVWLGFSIVSFITGLYQRLINGNGEIISTLVESTFEVAALGVEIALGLIGVLCLWLGIFKVAEQAGLIQFVARLLTPLFSRLMPAFFPALCPQSPQIIPRWVRSR